MAIGDSGIARTRRGPSNSAAGATPQSFGAGVGKAIKGLANAFNQKADAELMLENAEHNRQYKMDNFETERRFQEYKRVQVQNQDERFRAANVNGEGLTNTVDADMTTAQEDFMKTVPKALQETYKTKLNEFSQSTILGAFTVEQQLSDTYFKTELTRSTNTFASDVYAGNTTYEEALEATETLITSSNLTKIEQDELRHSSTAFLQEAEYKADARFRLNTGSAMATVPPAGKQLLDAISKPESTGKYNVRYNGHDKDGAIFDDYSKHPRIYIQRPDGRMSSAAGRYQFVYDTWKVVKAKLNLPDFSPESQDRAALWLAEHDYNSRNRSGPRFQDVVNSGDPVLLLQLKRSLGATWEGLPAMKDSEFLDIITGKISYGSSGDNRSTPDMFNDPAYSNIPFNRKLALANAASSAFNAQTTADNKVAAAEHESQLQNNYRAASSGGLTADMIPKLWENGSITKYSEEEKLRKLITGYQGNTAIDNEVVSTISSGEGLLTKDTHQESLNRLFGAPARESLGKKDTAYTQNSLYPLVEQLGFVPSEIGQALVGMARGADTEGRLYAMDTLLGIQTANPNALRNSDGFGDAMLEDLALYKAALGQTQERDKATILERLDQRHDPAQAQIIEARQKEAVKILTKDYPVNVLPNKLFDTMLSFEPDLPMDPNQQIGLQAMFNENYTRGFEMFGSDEGAFEYAKTQVQTRWGVSELGGTKRIMLDGVEKFYSRPDLVDQQIQGEMRKRRIPAGTNYSLIPSADAQAESAAWIADPAKAGNNVAYTIMYTDANGVNFMLSPEEGNAWVFNGAPDEDGNVREYPEDQLDSITNNAKVIELSHQLEQEEERLNDYRLANTPATGSGDPVVEKPTDDPEYQQLLENRDKAQIELTDAQSVNTDSDAAHIVDSYVGHFDLEKDDPEQILKAMGDMIFEHDAVVLRKSPEYQQVREILKRRMENE